MRPLLRVLVIAALAGWPGGANAAYQIMGLMASNGAIPLSCRGAECAAEFSAFCLQPERASPPKGVRYFAAGGEGIDIVGTTADGRTLRFPAGDHLRIVAQRGHNAVRISISAATLRTLGLEDAAVEVGELVSLLPQPIVGDPNPLTEADIAIATGPLRKLGARLVDHGGDKTVAAALTNDLINALPERGRAAPEVRDNLWSSLEGRWPRQAATGGGGEIARSAFERCRAKVGGGSFFTMRQCLGSAHDRLLGSRNNEYWRALKTGS